MNFTTYYLFLFYYYCYYQATRVVPSSWPNTPWTKTRATSIF